MGKLLVHIITGVENPSRSVLGFLVAKSAIEDGNEVTIFCAGDGVTSLHDITTKEMQGVGLGTLSNHLDELKSKGANLYASGKSAQARGITKEQLESLGFTPATPNKLVELTFEADRVLIYWPGSKKESSPNFKIFPNPTKNLITIEIENYNGGFEAELNDYSGKLLETTNLSLADYPNGVYSLKITYGDRVEE